MRALHVQVQDIFRHLVKQRHVVDRILTESQDEIVRARQVLESVLEAFPEVARAIVVRPAACVAPCHASPLTPAAAPLQTKQAIGALLKSVSTLNRELLTHGEVEEKEHAIIQAHITSAQKRLTFHPPVAALPDPHAMLAEVRSASHARTCTRTCE